MASCKKSDPVAPHTESVNADQSIELQSKVTQLEKIQLEKIQLEKKHQQLVDDIQNEMLHSRELQREIQHIEVQHEEIMAELKSVESVKKKSLEDVAKLKTRWEKETKDLLGPGCRDSIPEIMRSLINKTDQLLEENRKLKLELQNRKK